MNLPNIANSPRELTLSGTTYRARTLTLGQIGEVLEWLGGRAGVEKTMLSSEASRLALATTEGLSVVLHLSLASCHPGLSRDDARRLASGMDADDEAQLHAIAFRRLPGKPASDDDPPSKDLAEVNWGEIFESLSGHTASGYEAASCLTLDQFDNFVSRGEGWDPEALDPKDVQAMWEAAQVENQPETPDAA